MAKRNDNFKELKLKFTTIFFGIIFSLIAVSCNRDPLKDNSYDNKVILMPLNNTVQIDDYSIRTLEFKVGPRVGAGFTKYKAETDALLGIYTFFLTNVSKETKNFSLPIFELVDKNGFRYSPSGSAMAAFNMSGGNVYNHLTQLHPGIQKKMTVIFEIPKSVEANPYAVAFSSYNQKGFILTVPRSWRNYSPTSETKLIHERYFQMLILKEKIPNELEENFQSMVRKFE